MSSQPPLWPWWKRKAARWQGWSTPLLNMHKCRRIYWQGWRRGLNATALISTWCFWMSFLNQSHDLVAQSEVLEMRVTVTHRTSILRIPSLNHHWNTRFYFLHRTTYINIGPVGQFYTVCVSACTQIFLNQCWDFHQKWQVSQKVKEATNRDQFGTIYQSKNLKLLKVWSVLPPKLCVQLVDIYHTTWEVKTATGKPAADFSGHCSTYWRHFLHLISNTLILYNQFLLLVGAVYLLSIRLWNGRLLLVGPPQSGEAHERTPLNSRFRKQIIIVVNIILLLYAKNGYGGLDLLLPCVELREEKAIEWRDRQEACQHLDCQKMRVSLAGAARG